MAPKRNSDRIVTSDTDKLKKLEDNSGWLANQLRKLRNPYVVGGIGVGSGPISDWITKTFNVDVPVPGWLAGPILIGLIGVVDWVHTALKQQRKHGLMLEEILISQQNARRDFVDHLRDHHGFEERELEAWEENRERDAQEQARKTERKSKGNLAAFRPKTEQAVKPPENFDEGSEPRTLRPENRRR